MSNCAEVLVANGTGILLMLLILHYGNKMFQVGLLADKLYCGMVWLTVALCMVETATFLIDGKLFAGSRIMAFVLNELLYTMDLLFGFLWILFADTKVYSENKLLRKHFFPMILPLLVMLVLLIANIFNGWVFEISEENVYSRNFLFVFNYVVTYGYLLAGVGILYKNRRRTKRYTYLPVLLFILPVAIGSLLQFLFYGIATLWLSAAIGLTSLYISMQTENTYLDRLTGVYNRYYLETYVGSLYKEAAYDFKKKKFAALMIDLDNFKSINDRYGHVVGDDALIRSARILRASVGKNALVTRYGGDEFLIILREKNETEAALLVGEIQNNCAAFNRIWDKDYTLSFSIGYTVVDPSVVDKEEFFIRTDRAMYAAKRQKAEVGEHRPPPSAE
ncbi:MAG: GGDEF domain-containing protein [Eubacteriales bacterium]